MKEATPYEKAMMFIAAYDRPDGGAYEQHIVRLARTWRSLIRSRHSVQGIVNRIADELQHSKGSEYGSGWDDFRDQFITWAVAEEWLPRNSLREIQDTRKT